jgi:hypothetical protein
MDLPDIRIVVQWGATCSISTLWQRFGRCVRDPSLQGTAILFTEKENFDSERLKKAERAEKRRAKTVLKKAAKQQRTDHSEVKVEEGADVNNEPSGDDEKIGEARGKEAEKEERLKKLSGKSKKILDLVVDDVINAEHRGYQCRRIPIMTAFKNTEAGESFSSPSSAYIDGDEVALHHECNSELADGCTRCGPKESGLCCDLHSPGAFSFIHSPVTKPTRKLPCSSIPEHTANETDIAFSRDLDGWRCNEMEKTYGKHHLRTFGPGFIMGTTVRDRIVQCARFSKIRTIADLEKETKWDGVNEYADTILAMIAKHYPIPDPPINIFLPRQPNPFIPPLPDMHSHVPSTPNRSPQSITFIPYMAPAHSHVSPIVNPFVSYPQSQPVANAFIPLVPNVSQPQLAQYAPPLQPHYEPTVPRVRAPRQDPTCSACHKKGHTSTLSLSMAIVLI